MDQNQLKWITGFVWNIADDRLRDVYVRSKLKSASFPRRRGSSSGETGPANLDTRIRGYDDALYGRFIVDGELLEYESGTDLRDTEQVPLKEDGGIEAFFRREVLPHAPDAWIAMDAAKIGYEISFARYFYRPAPLRTLEQIRAGILVPEQQTEGLQVLRNGRLFSHRVQIGFPDLPSLEVSLRTGVRVRDMENLKRKQVMSHRQFCTNG